LQKQINAQKMVMASLVVETLGRRDALVSLLRFTAPVLSIQLTARLVVENRYSTGAGWRFSLPYQSNSCFCDTCPTEVVLMISKG